MDEYTNELALRDLSLTASQPSWHVLTLKLKFPNLAIGDVIRIRSASFDVTSTQKQMLLLSHYSNIMTFGENCKLAREIKAKVSEDKKAQLTLQTISEVSKDYHNMPPTPMIELFHSNESDPSIFGKSLFRVRFYVTKIEPSDVKEWVKGYDKKTKKFQSLKTVQATGTPSYHIQLNCKDISTQSNSKVYKIFLFSESPNTKEDPAQMFMKGIAPDNLHKNADTRKKLEEIGANLKKFNTWVDAVVERRNGFYFIRSTQLL